MAFCISVAGSLESFSQRAVHLLTCSFTGVPGAKVVGPFTICRLNSHISSALGASGGTVVLWQGPTFKAGTTLLNSCSHLSFFVGEVNLFVAEQILVCICSEIL